MSLFSDFSNNGSEFVKVRDKILERDTFDEWCESVKIASDTEKEFLKSWNGVGDISSSYQQWMKQNGKATLTFANLTKKASSIFKSFVATLASIGINWAIGKVIDVATTAIDNVVHAAEHCKERVNELMSSYQSALDVANDNADTIENIASRYEELSKGVGNFGDNISLTTDEYKEYNKIVKMK